MAVAHGLQMVVICLVLSVSSALREPVLYNSIPGCRTNVRLNPGNIIDIRASVDRGAELLTGRYENSLVSCIASCCNLARCDLVLYKNVGVSQSGKNCYFVQCGSSDNCVMVSHEGFTSVIIGVYADGTPTRSSWTAVTETPGSEAATMDSGVTTFPSSQLSSSSESLSTTPPTSPTISLATSDRTTTPMTTTTTITTATTMTTMAATTAASVSDTTNLGPVTSIPNATTSSTSGSTVLPSSHHGDEGETTSDRPVIATEGNTENEGGGGRGEANVTDPHKADNPSQLGNIPDSNPGSIIRAEDDCSQDGCDGGGVIAVAVVGSICFLIIVVVVAVVLKRIASDKRKKRFRNVDYLINGMYT